jgi:hydroxymethylbilane synthase
MNKGKIVIGTRGSELARTQTGMVADMVARIAGVPVETIIIKTEGDRIQDVPLHMVEGKGFFTKELEEALLEGRIDLAVHSLKDLPTESPKGLTIAAIPPREKANDLLLVRDGVVNEADPRLLPPNPTVGTSSKRRALQIKAMRPDATIKELRGNVPTRIAKLVAGEYDAILIAAAGYRRLSIEPRGYRALVLDLEDMLPAPGQGALALQTREDDQELVELLGALHDGGTEAEVDTERRALELLGGGCGMPLGIRAQHRDGAMHVRAILGPDAWQLHDAPVFVRAEAMGNTPAEAAERVIQTLTTAQED